MIVGIARESQAGENRVALTPDLVAKLTKAGHQVVVEPTAGVNAGFPDNAYQQAGAQLQADALSTADIVLKVQPPPAAEVSRMKEGAVLIGLLQPAANAELLQALAT